MSVVVLADPSTRRWARVDEAGVAHHHLLTAGASVLPTPTRDELLTHARRYYSDASIARDMDALLHAAGSDEDRRVVRAYFRMRKAAPGYAPGRDDANSHGAIPAEELARLDTRKRSTVTAGVGRIKSCAGCGKSFAYSRATARYCGPRCRQRAQRQAA